MTKPNSAEIVIVLDRSGSMERIKKDMEGGFNTFITDQRKDPSECKVTLYQFDSEYECVYSGKTLTDVPNLIISPRGSTALLDAVGRAVNETGIRLAAMKEEDRPARVLMIIITDGAENASKEFTSTMVKTAIDRQRKDYGWEFVYLGANQDSFAEAQKIGIAIVRNYTADASGVKLAAKGMSASVSHFRSSGKYQQ